MSGHTYEEERSHEKLHLKFQRKNNQRDTTTFNVEPHPLRDVTTTRTGWLATSRIWE